MFHCSRQLSAETTQKIVFHLLSDWVFQKRLVNGKKKQCQMNVCRNSILMMYHHQDLCSASNWMKQIVTQLEALAPSVWNFCRESNGGIVKCQLVSQARVDIARGTPI